MNKCKDCIFWSSSMECGGLCFFFEGGPYHQNGKAVACALFKKEGEVPFWMIRPSRCGECGDDRCSNEALDRVQRRYASQNYSCENFMRWGIII